MEKSELKQLIKEEISKILPTGAKPVLYQFFDTNDQEVIIEGTKKDILEWMWKNFTKGWGGYEINEK